MVERHNRKGDSGGRLDQWSSALFVGSLGGAEPVVSPGR
jgi:hypothetical protein